MKTNYLHKKQIALPKKQKLTTDNKIQNTHQVPSSPLVLSDLPDDILTIIFTSLYDSNPLNYLNLRRVCRTFNTLLTTQPISSGLDFSKFNPPLRRGGDTLLQQLLNLIKPTSINDIYKIGSRNKIKYDPVREFMTFPFWTLSETHITSKGVESISQNSPHLTHLNLSHTNITDAGLEHIKSLTNLTDLNLSSCERITGEGLAAVAQHFPKLTSLDLSYCERITGEGLAAVAQHFPKLTSLDLSYCERITGEGLRALANLTQLTFLNLGETGITDAGIRAITENCPNLTSLDLRYCVMITDAGIRAITENCPNLTFLNLAETDITNAGLAAVAKNCSNLTSLNLFTCKNITDDGLAAIAQHCTNLTYLMLNECFNITDDGLAAIAQHCTNLTYLNVWGCENIYDEDIARIQIALPHCEIQD